MRPCLHSPYGELFLSLLPTLQGEGDGAAEGQEEEEEEGEPAAAGASVQGVPPEDQDAAGGWRPPQEGPESSPSDGPPPPSLAPCHEQRIPRPSSSRSSGRCSSSRRHAGW